MSSLRKLQVTEEGRAMVKGAKMQRHGTMAEVVDVNGYRALRIVM